MALVSTVGPVVGGSPGPGQLTSAVFALVLLGDEPFGAVTGGEACKRQKNQKFQPLYKNIKICTCTERHCVYVVQSVTFVCNFIDGICHIKTDL